VLAVPKFASGLIYGMVGTNNLSEIEECATDGWSEIQSVEEIVTDLISGDIEKAAEEIIDFAKDMDLLLRECKSMQDDIGAIKSWASIFSDRAHLIATVSKNMLLHRKKIHSDIAELKAEWAAEEYFKSGTTTADLAYYAIGPISMTMGFDDDKSISLQL
jgi:hypothetical protein